MKRRSRWANPTIDALPLAALLVAALVFARLGVWQMQRAEETSTLDQRIEARGAQAEVALDPAVAETDPAALQWRHISARGSWDNDHQVLLDNQVSQGQAGYLVYTPLRLDACRCAVLVNRGWVPAAARRDMAPNIGDIGLAAARSATVRGVAVPPPAAGVGVDSAYAETVAPGLLRAQRIEAPALSAWVGVRLLPLVILLDPAAPEGYRRDWRPPGLRADRHTAYAVQWFIFAVIALGVAVRMNLRRGRRSNGTPQP
jgi:surfeit locus 1 family protein